jgi:glycosyltransferase involved in cell wall biosynthesis
MAMNETEPSPIISVVVPVYNSETTLLELRSRLETVLEKESRGRYEIIFVNDASTDSSWAILKTFPKVNHRIIAINLTRNFGQHNALMCGFSQASGDVVVTLDDDLQNPPEEIPRLHRKMAEGFDVVYGIPASRKHSQLKNAGSDLVQLVYRRIFRVSNRISSFRMVRRAIVQCVMGYDRSFSFIDGLLAWYTRDIGTVSVEHQIRAVGRSGYSIGKLMTLALNLLANFSIAPLQIASMTGVVFALLAFLIGSYMLMKKVFLDIPVSGFASLIVSITLFSGVQLMTIGLMGEYIGRMHINTSKRPQFAVRDRIGMARRRAWPTAAVTRIDSDPGLEDARSIPGRRS